MDFDNLLTLALAENSKLNKGSVIILNRNKAVLNT
jgi:hypothetical protein